MAAAACCLPGSTPSGMRFRAGRVPLRPAQGRTGAGWRWVAMDGGESMGEEGARATAMKIRTDKDTKPNKKIKKK